MTTTDNIQAAINAGTLIGQPHALDQAGRFFAVAVPDGGKTTVIDLEDHLDKHRDRPRRTKGTVTASDAHAFVAYVQKHGLPETEIWANAPRSQLVAVLNANQGTTLGEQPGWGDHRVQLGLTPTPAWAAWTKFDRHWLTQVDFAEHIEDRLTDIVDPTGATMLELAQTFSGKRSVQFQSSKRIKSGETQLQWVEDETATAGKKGDIAIPDTFILALRPYEGCDPYKVTARLRYRIGEGGHLSLGYVLDRPDEVQRAAFDDIVNVVHTELDQPVWNGTPT